MAAGVKEDEGGCTAERSPTMEWSEETKRQKVHYGNNAVSTPPFFTYFLHPPKKRTTVQFLQKNVEFSLALKTLK